MHPFATIFVESGNGEAAAKEKSTLLIRVECRLCWMSLMRACGTCPLKGICGGQARKMSRLSGKGSGRDCRDTTHLRGMWWKEIYYQDRFETSLSPL